MNEVVYLCDKEKNVVTLVSDPQRVFTQEEFQLEWADDPAEVFEIMGWGKVQK